MTRWVMPTRTPRAKRAFVLETLGNVLEIAVLCSPALIRVPKPLAPMVSSSSEPSTIIEYPASEPPPMLIASQAWLEDRLSGRCDYCGTFEGDHRCLNCGAVK